MVNVKIKRLRKEAILPFYATSGSAGMDLCSAIGGDVAIEPGKCALIHTGISMELPNGFEAQIRPRSGLALKHGITVLNAPGTVDSDYRGEVSALLLNTSPETFVVKPGMRIAQMVIAQYARISWDVVDQLGETQRGGGGFGSTGGAAL